MGDFFAVLPHFGVCQSEGRLAGDWEWKVGGWLTSFASASGEVGSGYLGRWLGVALMETGADAFRAWWKARGMERIVRKKVNGVP